MSKNALQQARDVSAALREAARRARFSTRSRRISGREDFGARRSTAIMRLAMILSFFAFVALPSLAAAGYYLFYASDQYVSEAQFTVSGGVAPRPDGLASLTGVPAIAVIQDTQIVTNYIHSRAATEIVETAVKLRTLYSRPDIDWFARFNAAEPIEKLVDYWKSMTSVSIKMPAGIIHLRVRAFTPQDASSIAQAVVSASEKLINDMDERMNHDAVTNAEQQVGSATARLTQTRLALEKARNESGILDANKSADAATGLITAARATLLQLQQEFQTQKQQVSTEAPQMKVLKSRIEAATKQIGELEAQVTRKANASSAEPTISGVMAQFAELDLENKIAERLYAGALTALEGSRLAAQHKMMYLTTFIEPVAPQDAQYPRRFLTPFLIFCASIVAWGMCCLLANLARNYMA